MIRSPLPQTDLSKYQPAYSEKDEERANEWVSLLTITHLIGNVMHKELWLSWTLCCSSTSMIAPIMGQMPSYSGFGNTYKGPSR